MMHAAGKLAAMAPSADPASAWSTNPPIRCAGIKQSSELDE